MTDRKDMNDDFGGRKAKYMEKIRRFRLMHDFYCTDAGEMTYAVLSERARYFKEDEKGKSGMCRIMDELMEELAEEERLKTKYETSVKIAISIWKYGVHDIKQIAAMTELSIEDVKKAIADIAE